MKRFLLFLVFAVSMPSSIAGLKEGLEAVAANDYERAYRELLPLAEEGNAEAQSHIGRLYGIGKPMGKDYAKAFEWLSRAARGGNASAQLNLATQYRDGIGVSRDYGQAMAWYRRAAEQGEDRAYLDVANMYARALGVPLDLAESAHWIRKAAEADNPLAEYMLGVRYWQGIGLPRNADEAFKWFYKAANQKYKPAMVSLGMMYFGDGLPVDPVEGCTWLYLAERLGITPGPDTTRLEKELIDRCYGLPPEQRISIGERMGRWQPKEIWYERQQREFQELLKKAAEEDARRATERVNTRGAASQ